MPSWLRRILPYTWPIRVALGAMFLLSAASALANHSAFIAEIRQYGIVPDPLIAPFSYALPLGELALGLMLLLGLFTRLAAAGGALLMVVFMVAIAYRLITAGEAANCGCFSLLGQEQLTWWTFGRDVVFLAALALTFLDQALWVSADRYLFGWGLDAGAEAEGPVEEELEPQAPAPRS